MTSRRTFMMEMAALVALPFAWSTESAYAATQTYDFSPEQTGRVRAPTDPDAQRLLAGYRLVSPGVLTVAVAPFDPPIATYATDARSVVGAIPITHSLSPMPSACASLWCLSRGRTGRSVLRRANTMR